MAKGIARHTPLCLNNQMISLCFAGSHHVLYDTLFKPQLILLKTYQNEKPRIIR